MSTIFSKAFHKYLWLNKFSFPFHSQNIYGITNWASHFINSPQYLYLNSLFLPFSHFLLIFHNINIFAASSYIDQIITSIAHLFHFWTEKLMYDNFLKPYLFQGLEVYIKFRHFTNLKKGNNDFNSRFYSTFIHFTNVSLV